MARIYISYNNKDTQIASQLSSGLKDLGHEISIDIDILQAGDSMRSKLQSGIRNSDGVIVLITDNSLKSQYVLTEIGTARTLSETNPNKFFIPVIVGDIEIPPIVQDIFCLRMETAKIDDAVNKLHSSIVSFQSTKEQEEKKVKQFESDLSTYVADVIDALKQREKKNKNIGQIWYILGYIALLAGVIFGVVGFINIVDNPELAIGGYVILSLKSLITIGLLIALSKYAFNLGKSYTNEALKNADRIHALSFGEFYLKAFREKVSYDQIKEVFQHWNINNESFFSTLNTNDFDPKVFENIIELLKVLDASKKKK